jgi:hypothetical protein
MVFIEFGITGILLGLVIFGVDAVQQEVAVGYDVAHVLRLDGVVKGQAVNDFLRAALDAFHVLSVKAVRVEGNSRLCAGCEGEEQEQKQE